MKSLRLIWIEPAFLRLTTFAGKVLANHQLQARERRSAMYRSYDEFSLAKASLSLLLVLMPAFALRAVAQDTEQTWGDSFVPLVYHMENTGAGHQAPNFPPFAQLPIIRPLPDPFVFFANGQRDTDFSSWERRRNEIFNAVENYMLGPKPDCHDCTITANYVPSPTNSLSGTLTVNVTRNGQTMSETAAVTLPSSGSGPFPYVIGIATATGSLPASLFTNVATVAYNQNQVTTLGNPQPTDGFYMLYPNLCSGPTCTVATNYGKGGSNSGQYAAWAWGISRLIDGIEIAKKQAVNPLPLDTTHSAVTGCSYAGKEALYAGALDERIALTIAQENGGGGAPSFRFNHDVESPEPPGLALGAGAGSVEDIDDTDYHWFAGQMFQFAGNSVYKLPIDQHELMAMVAPRALLQTGNTDFYWLGNGAAYVSSRATQRIYNQFGIGDRFGFIIDGNHNHCAVPTVQMPQIAAFIDKFLLGQDVSTDVEIHPNPYVQEETQPPFSLPMGDFSGNYQKNGVPFPTDYPYLFTTIDYRRWTHWWGSDDPLFPNNWNTGGTFDLGLHNRLNFNSGDTVVAGYDIAMPGEHPAATVNVPNANIQMDISCPDGSSYTLAIPLSAETYSIPANDNGWFPSAVQNSPLVYQGSATNPGCSSGGKGKATRAYFTAVGVQDGFAGDGAGPGFITTDTMDPTNVRFHAADSTNGSGGHWSETITVNPNPLNYPSPPLPQQF